MTSDLLEIYQPHLGAGDGWLRMTIDHGFPPLTQLLQAAVVCIT